MSNASPSSSSSSSDDHHSTPVCKLSKRKDQQQHPPHTEPMNKKKNKKLSGSQRRKRKKEKKLTTKRSKVTIVQSSQQEEIQQEEALKNRFLHREKAVGKRSLLQEQLEQHLTSTSDEGAEQVHPRQKVVAYGAATFTKALRGWSGVPCKRLCYRLQKCLPVVLVNEFRTSQISNLTLQKLNDVYHWKPAVSDASGTSSAAERKLTLCWGLKEYECKSDDNDDDGLIHKGLADRNRNAAANMRDLLSYWLVHHDRPPQFKCKSQSESNDDTGEEMTRPAAAVATASSSALPSTGMTTAGTRVRRVL